MAEINPSTVSTTLNLPEVILEGERNETIFRYGAKLRNIGRLSNDEIARLLHEANESRCMPPMDEAEVNRIIRSVQSLKSGKPIGAGVKSEVQSAKVPEGLTPTEQAASQLEALFSAEDFITFITKFSKEGEKWAPTGKPVSKVAYQVIQELRRSSSIDEVFPDYNKEAGILFYINPMKYNGRKNSEVKAFRSALVEYDDIPKAEQERRLLDSGLPILSVTDSGNKSLHAIVRIDADDYSLYKSRVAELHEYLEKKYGSPCDGANKNPARMSRLAGARRGDSTQSLLYTEINFSADLEKIIDEHDKADELTSGKFRHDLIGDALIESRDACIVDGMPVIRSGDRYQVGQDSVFKAVLDIRRDPTTRQRKEVMEYLALVAPHRQQADQKFIRFKNGVLDIETLDLRPADHDHIVLNEIPHNWKPEAKSELVDRTFQRIARNDAAVIANLWEMFGLAIYRGHEVSRMVLLQGSGANGKSTLLDMLKFTLGQDNCFSLSIHELGEKFQLVPAMGKLAIIGDDIASDYVSQKACAVMKKFVTGEMVSDQYKGGATFQFEPYATLIYSCNEIPRFGDATFGFERRVHPIPLTAKFTPYDEGYDPRLKQKLCTEECAEYALVKAVEALRGCLLRYTLTPNRLSDEMRTGILEESDSTLAFIREKKGSGFSFVGGVNTEVYSMYSAWCEERGCEAEQQTAFSRKLCRQEGLKSVSSNGCRVFAKKNG